MSVGFDHYLLLDIATHTHVPVAQVQFTYEKLCMNMRAHARIHDFIPLLAMNQLRTFYSHHDS